MACCHSCCRHQNSSPQCLSARYRPNHPSFQTRRLFRRLDKSWRCKKQRCVSATADCQVHPCIHQLPVGFHCKGQCHVIAHARPLLVRLLSQRGGQSKFVRSRRAHHPSVIYDVEHTFQDFFRSHVLQGESPAKSWHADILEEIAQEFPIHISATHS